MSAVGDELRLSLDMRRYLLIAIPAVLVLCLFVAMGIYETLVIVDADGDLPYRAGRYKVPLLVPLGLLGILWLTGIALTGKHCLVIGSKGVRLRDGWMLYEYSWSEVEAIERYSHRKHHLMGDIGAAAIEIKTNKASKRKSFWLLAKRFGVDEETLWRTIEARFNQSL